MKFSSFKKKKKTLTLIKYFKKPLKTNFLTDFLNRCRAENDKIETYGTKDGVIAT